MRPLLLVLLALSACRQAETPTPAAVSACHEQRFEDAGFTVCSVKGGRVEVRSGSRSFNALAATLGQVAPALAWLPAWLAGPPLGYLGWLARTAARMPGAEASVALTPVGAAAVYAVAAGVFAFGAVVVAVAAPTLSAEPSAGNANEPPPLEVGGAEIWLVDPPG